MTKSALDDSDLLNEIEQLELQIKKLETVKAQLLEACKYALSVVRDFEAAEQVDIGYLNQITEAIEAAEKE